MSSTGRDSLKHIGSGRRPFDLAQQFYDPGVIGLGMTILTTSNKE